MTYPGATTFSYPSLEPDFSTTMALVREYNNDALPNNVYKFPLIRYLRKVTPESQWIDDLHMEVLVEDERFQEYSFRAYVSAEPKTQDLTKYGLDEPRSILVYPALPILEDAQLAVQVSLESEGGEYRERHTPTTYDEGRIRFLVNPGDRLWFQSRVYEVNSIHEDQFFGNTQIPLYLVLACQVWRQRTDKLYRDPDINFN